LRERLPRRHRAVHGPLQLLPRRGQALLHPLRDAQRADHPVRHLQPVLPRRQHRCDPRRLATGALGPDADHNAISDPATPDSRPSDARRRLSSASALMLFIGILMLLPGLCVLLLAWVVVSDVGPYRTAQSKLGDLGKFMLTTGFGWFWILC